MLKVNGHRAGAWADHMEFVKIWFEEFPSEGQKLLASIKKTFIVVPPCRQEKWRFAEMWEDGAETFSDKIGHRIVRCIVASLLEIHSLTHSFIWKLFIAGLLCAGGSAGCGEPTSNGRPCLPELTARWGRQIMIRSVHKHHHKLGKSLRRDT